MKTIKQAIEESNISPKLIRGVIKQLGGYDCAKESMEDIVNHGINGGFHGFIYYTDTIAFFKKFRKEIVELVENMANVFGEDEVNMVANFNCLQYQNYYRGKKEIKRALYGRISPDDSQVANALAWFAGEEVSRLFVED